MYILIYTSISHNISIRNMFIATHQYKNKYISIVPKYAVQEIHISNYRFTNVNETNGKQENVEINLEYNINR